MNQRYQEILKLITQRIFKYEGESGRRGERESGSRGEWGKG
jgi:hypothetical protein